MPRSQIALPPPRRGGSAKRRCAPVASRAVRWRILAFCAVEAAVQPIGIFNGAPFSWLLPGSTNGVNGQREGQNGVDEAHPAPKAVLQEGTRGGDNIVKRQSRTTAARINPNGGGKNAMANRCQRLATDQGRRGMVRLESDNIACPEKLAVWLRKCVLQGENGRARRPASHPRCGAEGGGARIVFGNMPWRVYHAANFRLVRHKRQRASNRSRVISSSCGRGLLPPFARHAHPDRGTAKRDSSARVTPICAAASPGGFFDNKPAQWPAAGHPINRLAGVGDCDPRPLICAASMFIGAHLPARQSHQYRSSACGGAKYRAATAMRYSHVVTLALQRLPIGGIFPKNLATGRPQIWGDIR